MNALCQTALENDQMISAEGDREKRSNQQICQDLKDKQQQFSDHLVALLVKRQVEEQNSREYIEISSKYSEKI